MATGNKAIPAPMIGPYQQYTERVRMRKPSLSNLCQFLSDPQPRQQQCRITSLNFYKLEERAEVVELDFGTLESMLINEAGSTADRNVCGRIVVVEDLSPEIIELLGTQLNIDPVFFAGHIYSSGETKHTQTPDQCMLPSQAKSHGFVNIHYHRALVFDGVQPPKDIFLRKTNIRRKVVPVPLSSDEYIGLSQHCISVLLSRKHSHWICLVLVDRPISDEYLSSPWTSKHIVPLTLPSKYFLGGYDDFLDSSIIVGDRAMARPMKERCPLKELVYYWSVAPPRSFSIDDPSMASLCYLPLKLVSAEWMNYTGIMYRAVKQFEYSTPSDNARYELKRLNEDMMNLQRWRRRSLASGHKVKQIVRFLRSEKSYKTCQEDCSNLVEDFKFIAATVDEFGRRLEGTIPTVTSLIQIIDSRRSLDQTANISRLTILALLFVPLTYVSSIFSMIERYGPSGSLFWVYFAVAIPVTILVLLVAQVPLNKTWMEWASLRKEKIKEKVNQRMNMKECV